MFVGDDGPAIAQTASKELRKLVQGLVEREFDQQLFANFQRISEDVGEKSLDPSVLGRLSVLDGLAPDGRGEDAQPNTLLGDVVSILAKATEDVRKCESAEALRNIEEGAAGWGFATMQTNNPFACAVLAGGATPRLYDDGKD